jgi:ribonuclease P protein component
VALPKANRLRKREDFNCVYQRGTRKRARYLSLIALAQKSVNVRKLPSRQGELKSSNSDLRQLPPTQIGVSISQKVSKRAVIRNRIKRQIQAAIYTLLPSFSLGWKLIVVVHPSAVECDYFQFLRELEQLLIDAEVLNGHS